MEEDAPVPSPVNRGSRWSRALARIKVLGKWKRAGLITIGLIVLAAAAFIYYYRRIPAETIVVIVARFPPNLPPGFSEDQVSDYMLAEIQKIHHTAEVASGQGTHLGIQVASPNAPYLSWRVSLPTFDQKVRDVTPNMLRQWALTAKAKHFLNINATSASQNRFRLMAVLQDRPDFAIVQSWMVPATGEPCEGLDFCIAELAEGILAIREPQTLILYYIKQNNEVALGKVVKLYESGAITEPTKVDYYAWADALQGLGRYDEAINQYSEVLRLDKTFCAAHNAVGTTYIRKYESETRAQYLDAARSAYRQALTCNPGDAVAHCNLGSVLIRLWKAGGLASSQLMNEAIAESERALNANPQLAEAAVNIGHVRYMQGQRLQALEYFRSISQTFPRSATVFVNFGFLLTKEYVNGRADALQEAIDKTRKAWDLDHRSYIAANNLAFLYYEIASLSDALQLWGKAYELNATSSDILAGSALGLFKSGSRVEAMRRYCEAVRRDPNIQDPEYLRAIHMWTPKTIGDISALRESSACR